MNHPPDWDDAIVEKKKLDSYLLSESHPTGKSKARWFKRHGYSSETLEVDLKSAGKYGRLVDVEENPFGTKLAVVSTFHTPIGTNIVVRTVWILEVDSSIPRLITAYPEKG